MKKSLMERLAFLLIAALFAAGTAASALADEQFEWDPAWGYHEEEWYDPSDWFGDDHTVSYEDRYYGDYEHLGDASDRDRTRAGEQAWDEYGYDDVYLYDDHGYDRGWDYYTDDWFDEEPDFDDWYDD